MNDRDTVSKITTERDEALRLLRRLWEWYRFDGPPLTQSERDEIRDVLAENEEVTP